MSAAAPDVAPAPAESLARLASILREEGTVISHRVVDPAAAPVLGELCARGPRAAPAPGDYALVIESVLEGYLLHYGTSRVLAGHDPDLALLAGDYLYAQGIERLAALGDTAAVRELADLISLSAEARAEGREELTGPLWLAATMAVACGSSDAHEAAKTAARALDPGAAEALLSAARGAAAASDLTGPFDHAADSLDFCVPELPEP